MTDEELVLTVPKPTRTEIATSALTVIGISVLITLTLSGLLDLLHSFRWEFGHVTESIRRRWFQ